LGASGADPDEALLARVGQGDPAAVRALVARKLPRLLALAGRILGETAEAEVARFRSSAYTAASSIHCR
jgi:hypothetical protein